MLPRLCFLKKNQNNEDTLIVISGKWQNVDTEPIGKMLTDSVFQFSRNICFLQLTRLNVFMVMFRHVIWLRLAKDCGLNIEKIDGDLKHNVSTLLKS